MAKERNEDTVREFVESQLDDISDFCFLFVLVDKKLKAEALSDLQRKFEDFVNEY